MTQESIPPHFSPEDRPPNSYPGWSRRQWWNAFWILLVAHSILLILFSRMDAPGQPPGDESAAVVWITAPMAQESLSKMSWVSHPLLFAGESDGAFSQVATRQLPRTRYQLMDWNQPTRWLQDGPGRWLPDPPLQPTLAQPFQPRMKLPLESDAAPPLPRREDSAWILDDGLTERLLEAPPSLSSLEGVEIGGATHLDVLVDARGWVLSVRIHRSCGHAFADSQAAEAARTLRFRPDEPSAEIPSWGRVQVLWATNPPKPSPDTPIPSDMR